MPLQDRFRNTVLPNWPPHSTRSVLPTCTHADVRCLDGPAFATLGVHARVARRGEVNGSGSLTTMQCRIRTFRVFRS